LKITVLYFSQTGNTEKMAGVVRDGILGYDGDIEVSLMNIISEDNIDKDFLSDSSAVIFGTPTYVAGTCWQMKKFFDTRFDCKLDGKLAACFSTAGCLWGGPDIAIQSILEMALTHGMLAYSSGTEFGRPYIHLGPIALMNKLEENNEIFTLFGKRIAQKTAELFKK
jgi:NAD(P)H dehydrogenase (quinone)